MVVESPPVAAFVVVEAELVLEYLVIAFDAPAELREAHRLADVGLLGHGGEPVLRGFAAAVGPFDQQPLDGAGLPVPHLVLWNETWTATTLATGTFEYDETTLNWTYSEDPADELVARWRSESAGAPRMELRVTWSPQVTVTYPEDWGDWLPEQVPTGWRAVLCRRRRDSGPQRELRVPYLRRCADGGAPHEVVAGTMGSRPHRPCQPKSKSSETPSRAARLVPCPEASSLASCTRDTRPQPVPIRALSWRRTRSPRVTPLRPRDDRYRRGGVGPRRGRRCRCSATSLDRGRAAPAPARLVEVLTVRSERPEERRDPEQPVRETES